MKLHQRNAGILFWPLIALLAAFSIPAIAADKEGGPRPEAAEKRDNPEKKAGPRDGEGGARKGPKDAGKGAKPAPKPGANKGVPVNVANSREAKVFVAYDKDTSGTVSDEEIVAMIEGKQNSRGKREIRKAVDRADKDNDKVLNYDEFLWWYRIGRTDERARNR